MVAALAVVLDDRRRQPVLHQRRADGGQPAGHDHRGAATTSRSSTTACSSRSPDRCSCGPPSSCPAGSEEQRHADSATTAGPLSGTLVVDLSRALAGPARHDDARRPRRPGDQGRGARHAATTPAAGGRRSSGPRTATPRGVDVLPVGQPQQGVDHPRPQGRRRQATCCSSWSAAPTCWSRTSAPACSTGSASASRRCRSCNPRLVVLSITGFGHDGPEGGRAGYDQIAQGEAGLMSLTGSGPDDPQRVGRADRRPAGRHVRRLRRRWPRCSSASAPARAPSCAPRCWPPIVGVHAFQGTRWTVAGEVGPRPGQPPPVDRAVRPVPLRRRVRADRGGQREDSGSGSAPGSDIDPATPGIRHQRRARGEPASG